MPTGFLPNPVSPTRRPSCQTRWGKSAKISKITDVHILYMIYILIIGIYIVYINISMRFKQKKQSLGHIRAPLFLDLIISKNSGGEQ